jgi:hypothetical protein
MQHTDSNPLELRFTSRKLCYLSSKNLIYDLPDHNYPLPCSLLNLRKTTYLVLTSEVEVLVVAVDATLQFDVRHLVSK